MRKFYIVDYITQSIIIDKTLDQVKGIYLELSREERTSFDVFENNYYEGFSDILTFDKSRAVTKRFKITNNKVSFEG